MQIQQVSPTKLIVRNIANESQMDMVQDTTSEAQCSVEYSDHSSTATITGEISWWIDIWNL